MTTAAIILAGGRASRLGGVDKPQLVVGGASLLERAVSAVSGCSPIVVVGPAAPVTAHVVWTREEPPFGGPVAAIITGLARVDTAEVYLLAADTPRASEAVALLGAYPFDHASVLDGVCLADAGGRAQWLLGRYRTGALRAAAEHLPDGGRGASVRALLASLHLAVIDAGEVAADVDAWDDLERARAGLPAEETT